MSCDPTFSALMRAVLEAPDDDAPRLILADWHDEQAERVGKEWHAKRAAAIRSGCAAPWRAWSMPGLEFAGRRECFAGTNRRGFLERVEFTAAEFLAEAARLFAAHPITGVRLIDRAPSWRLVTNAPRRLGWRNQAALMSWPDDLDVLPAPIFSALTGASACGFVLGRWYESEADALAALSRACVCFGRQLAGLSPYTFRDNAKPAPAAQG